MYKSYSINNMPELRNSFNAAAPPLKDPPLPVIPEKKAVPTDDVHKKNELSLMGLKTDDIILLGIILLLLMSDCKDKLLFAALGYIFFTGFNGQ